MFADSSNLLFLRAIPAFVMIRPRFIKYISTSVAHERKTLLYLTPQRGWKWMRPVQKLSADVQGNRMSCPGLRAGRGNRNKLKVWRTLTLHKHRKQPNQTPWCCCCETPLVSPPRWNIFVSCIIRAGGWAGRFYAGENVGGGYAKTKAVPLY